MAPLFHAPFQTVSRRIMSTASMGTRFELVCALLCLLAIGVLAPAGARPAAADETAPPDAVAPAPAPAVARDSLVVAAPPDSAGKAQEGANPPAKDPQPAPVENIEKAAPTPAPEGAAPGAGVQLKAKPQVGTRPPVARSPRSLPKTRALAKPVAPRNHPNTALPNLLHEGISESDRVGSELERTERFVTRAQKSILLSKNTRALKLFTSALDFQSDSREACKVRQYARAERLTLAARDFADRASRMVGPPREDPDYVDHVMKRTDDALERAKDVLRTGAGRDSWRRHEDLKQEQKEAWRVFKGGDFNGAYRQTLGVREGVLALLRQLQDLPVPREAAEKAIGGAQAALEQANRELGPKPNVEAGRLVKLASEYLVKARQSFSRGSYRSALLQAKVVERHVEHAVDVGRPRSEVLGEVPTIARR